MGIWALWREMAACVNVFPMTTGYGPAFWNELWAVIAIQWVSSSVDL